MNIIKIGINTYQVRKKDNVFSVFDIYGFEIYSLDTKKAFKEVEQYITDRVTEIDDKRIKEEE